MTECGTVLVLKSLLKEPVLRGSIKCSEVDFIFNAARTICAKKSSKVCGESKQ